MKLKNLVLNLSKDDILNLISLQDKTIIKKLELGSRINASGIYKLVGLNIDFDTSMTIDIEKMVKAYCTDTYGVKLDKLDISTLNTSNGCFEFGINILDINLGNLKNLNNLKK